MLLFLLPLVNVAAVKRTIRSVFPKITLMGHNAVFDMPWSSSMKKQAPQVYLGLYSAADKNAIDSDSDSDSGANTSGEVKKKTQNEQPHGVLDSKGTGGAQQAMTKETGPEHGVGLSLIDSQCNLCESPSMLMPYAAHPCGHVFCYYCLRSKTLADSSFECPVCFERVCAISPAIDPTNH